MKTSNKKTTKINKENKENKEDDYFVSVKIFNKTYTASGKTIAEAINNLKPTNCKGRSILSVRRGDVSKDRILMPIITYRLFNTHGLSKEIAVKNASLLFQGL